MTKRNVSVGNPAVTLVTGITEEYIHNSMHKVNTIETQYNYNGNSVTLFPFTDFPFITLFSMWSLTRLLWVNVFQSLSSKGVRYQKNFSHASLKICYSFDTKHLTWAMYGHVMNTKPDLIVMSYHYITSTLWLSCTLPGNLTYSRDEIKDFSLVLSWTLYILYMD